MLKINNAFKSFGNLAILNNINLHITKNSIVGLAGPSGGGKSTLLRVMQKLENLDRGTLDIHGSTGFMFQDFQLFPHMNVFDNLTYATKVLNYQDYHQHAKDLLTKLCLINKEQHYPDQLSGGQKQRVALARSLMLKPDILLCDEPTSGLDIATINDVVDLLLSVHKMSVTMVIASHDLDFLAKIAYTQKKQVLTANILRKNSRTPPF